jgi:hypothetical protein
MKHLAFSLGTFLCATAAFAQLSVKVSAPKVVGQKAIVSLVMKNSFSENVDSARAVVLLMNEQGKMVGQAAKWVIGGDGKFPGLRAGATNIFNFVISAPKPFTTTNLTARVQFNRVVMEGGKLADVTKAVEIETKNP